MKKFDISVPIEKVISDNPFFTTLISELRPVEDPNTPTIATNGSTLNYNPGWMAKLSDAEACGAILHESLHCAFQHLWRRKERHPFVFNCATDYAINSIVVESYPLPKGSLLDSKYYGMSAEQIYEDLLKKKNKGQGWCNKNGWETKPKRKGVGGIIDRIIRGKKAMPTSDIKPTSPHDEHKWKNIFENDILKNYGQMTDSIKRVIEKNFYIPTIDWASLVTNLLSEDNMDYSFSYPDRRFLGEEFLLPDMQSLTNLKDVVFAFDTSGSISKDELFSFYMEMMGLFNNFSNIEGHVAICDCELKSFKKFSPREPFDQLNFMGGGGTSFTPVFEEITKKGISPKAVFYFTDLEGDFPRISPDYPVFWLVRSYVGDNYDRNVPFGQVIKFLPKN